MTAPARLNILIADDHRLFSEGLFRILSEEKNIGKIYLAANGGEAIDIAERYDIDCAIMDINMPVVNGLDATIDIKRKNPLVKIIVVSMLCDALIVSRLLKAGANAFINKDAGVEELKMAIAKTHNNEIYISPVIAAEFVTHHATRTTEEKTLTPREIEITRLIADGLKNSDIAAKLFLSTATVNTHRKNILAKLNLHNTAALIRYATDKKIL